MQYQVPIFGDDSAMNIAGIEDPDADPILKDIYPHVDAAMATQVNRGWVWDDGELTSLASAKIRTEWDRATGIPRGHTVDSGGRAYAPSATIISACPWNTWSNAEMDVCLARREWEGRVGHGDSQLAVWTDFTQLLG